MARIPTPGRRGGQTDEPDDSDRTASEQERHDNEPEGAREAGDGGQHDDGEQQGRRERTITGELKETIRESAIEVLRPAVREATRATAKAAVAKGPDLVKSKVGRRVA